MKPNLQMNTQQTMAMTPQLLQSIRLLQLSSLELEQELREALESNVMLESVEADEDAELEETQADADTELQVQSDAVSQVEIDYEGASQEGWNATQPRAEGDDAWETRVAMPEQTDARLAAIAQLELMIETPREARLIAAILDAIDDNGYLAQPLDGIAFESELDPSPTDAELEAALRKVQSVEPTGFGARDLRECLLLQIDALPEGTPSRVLAYGIVDTHLEWIAARDFDAICAEFELDALELHEALDLILALDPKPGARYSAPAEAALPDVTVSGTPGAWRIELNGGRLPRVRVNRMYERMLQGESGHRAIKDQLQEARWLVRGIEMRNDTLLRTTRAVFERQTAFLERGEEGMVSLTLREIADAIGMHESTICRITNNKWVQTPWGVYELKAFFPSQITGSENETSGTAVKAMIRRIINTESPEAPLCDGDITAILARNGVRVARRTVAKYREAMRIPSAKDRVPTRGARHLRLVC